MVTNEPIFEHLEFIAESILTPFSWLDLHGKCLGVNTLSMQGVGTLNKTEIIGRNLYQIYKNDDIAEKLYCANDKVAKTGITLQTEDETIDVITGQTKFFSAIRAPIRNRDNDIVGIMATAIDITAQKEATQLKLANINSRPTSNTYLKAILDCSGIRFSKQYDSYNLKTLRLTEIERDVLFCIYLGINSRKDIAYLLSFIYKKTISSTTTVNDTIRRLYQKLNCTTATQLLEFATINNLYPQIPHSFRVNITEQ